MAVNHSFNTAGKIQDFGACVACHNGVSARVVVPYHAKPTKFPGWYGELANAPGRGSFNIFYSTLKPSRIGEGSSMEGWRNYGEDGQPGRTKDANWKTPKIAFNWVTISSGGKLYDVPAFSSSTTPPTTAPTITSISPTSGSDGTTVTITGTNFGATKGTSYVLFGTSTKPTTTSWSATSIKFTVPSVSSGTYKVSVVVNGVASGTKDFSVSRGWSR